MLVEDAESRERRAAWNAPRPHFTRGFGTLYLKHVTRPTWVATSNFLEGGAATAEPRIH